MQRNRITLLLILTLLFISVNSRGNQPPSDPRIKETVAQIELQIKDAQQDKNLDNPLYSGKLLKNALINSPINLSLAKTKYQPQTRQAWGWWQLLITSDFLPGYEQLPINAIEGGLEKDDLVAVAYNVPEGYIQIVDGRTITVTLWLNNNSKYREPIFEARVPLYDWLSAPRRKKKLVTQAVPEILEPIIKPMDKEAREKYVHAVFRRVFRFDYRQENDIVKSRIETRNSSPINGSYGVLLTERSGAGWFMNGTITWWTDGEVIVFDIAKVKEPPVSKVPYKNFDYVFGLPINDGRRFDRFSAISNIDFDQVLKFALNDKRLTKYMPVRKVGEDIIHSRPVNRLIQTPE